jgi:hypothetical protein
MKRCWLQYKIMRELPVHLMLAFSFNMSFVISGMQVVAVKDDYRCPAGQRLTWRFTSVEKGMKLHRYWSSNCQTCSLKPQCTPSQQRRVTRWEHEDVLDAAQARLDNSPDAMRIRRQTVEHPFGTIKSWMGATYFLTRTRERVGTEMSLHVLAYNLKRVMAILGIVPLMAAMKA